MSSIFNKSIQIALDAVSDGFHTISDSLTKKDPYNASFGKASDIGSIFESGIQISKNVKLSKAKSSENIIISGVTGSGKTSRFIIPNIFEAQDVSLCINDPSKEIYNATSRCLSSKRFSLKTLNFANSRESSGYNPMSQIRIMSDIYKLSDLLVRTTIDKNTSDPFWGLQSRSLLNCFQTLLFYFPVKYRNLANINQLIKLFSADPEKIDQWIVATRDNQLCIDYKAIISTPERTLQNCIASTKSVLSFIEDPQIARVTSFDTLNMRSMRTHKTALFLHNSIGNLKYVNILNGIFFEQYFNHLLKRLPHSNEYELINIIDEASSLYIPSLSTFLANNRKYKIINILSLQAPHQLKTLYKEDANDILSNCVTKIYLPGHTENQTLKELETLSGQTTFIDKKGNKTVRQLITAQEIRTMSEDEALIVSGNKKLIRTRTTPYYKALKYKEYATQHPIPLRSDIPRHSIPLLH